MKFFCIARSLSSMSSNSSTSTRSSRQQTITSLKRSISPTITLAVERSSEKRRRQREQRKTKSVSDDIEQENDDDDNDNKSKKPKQRQGSNSSVEYVQIINNNQQSISSLNNIENYNEDIILCHSPPTVKKVISSSKKIVRIKSNQNLVFNSIYFLDIEL